MKRILILSAFFLIFTSTASFAANYVTATNTIFFSDADKTQVFISTKTSTPKGTVVVFHGMIMMNFEIYTNLILDLTNRGYDVIFPQYQEAGIATLESMGVLALLGGSSPSHIDWTQHAINGINWALNKKLTYPRSLFNWVTRKPAQNLYFYAHSIGGAIAYNVPYMSPTIGSKVKGMILGNCVLDPTVLAGQTMPAGIEMPDVEMIDVAAAGQFVTMPVLFLTGNQDQWGTLEQGAQFINNAASANKKMLKVVDAKANHMGPACNMGPLFDLMGLLGINEMMFGGTAEWNYLDTNFYEAGLLHLINYNNALTFNPSVTLE